MMPRRLAFAAALLWAGVAAPAAAEPPLQLPEARDFAADAREARSQRLPILVFFAAGGCPYCQEVEELYLKPMQARGEDRGRYLLRVVHVDSARRLRDFDGRPTDHGSFAAREGIWLTPVIRFYGPDGRQLAPPLVGYSSPDFYAGYLEQGIENALTQLRRPAAAASSPGSSAASAL